MTPGLPLPEPRDSEKTESEVGSAAQTHARTWGVHLRLHCDAAERLVLQPGLEAAVPGTRDGAHPREVRVGVFDDVDLSCAGSSGSPAYGPSALPVTGPQEAKLQPAAAVQGLLERRRLAAAERQAVKALGESVVGGRMR